MRNKSLPIFLKNSPDNRVLKIILLVLIVVNVLLLVMFSIITTNKNLTVVKGAYGTVRDLQLFKTVIRLQQSTISMQADYITSLEFTNKILQKRNDELSLEVDGLKNDMDMVMTPVLNRLGYDLAFVGGRIYVHKSNGSIVVDPEPAVMTLDGDVEE